MEKSMENDTKICFQAFGVGYHDDETPLCGRPVLCRSIYVDISGL